MERIELEPCYPKGQTLKMQLEKIKEEYNEVLEASKLSHKIQELLDLKQTIVGYYHIQHGQKWKNKLLDSKLAKKPYYSEKSLEYFWRYYDDPNVREKFKIKIGELFWLADIVINQMISKDLLKIFLGHHKQKLESRKKQWAKENKKENKEVI
ncbi:hypothetical protein [Orenia marismortui]|uniref:Uncharacterized protein n=1 Tax=Orenia marismortui TaxID=46469 RepID=A0A4R8H024_9FIRM|nr:hypothetical protein [Orenia marismortui]TDX48297.1 hypothetical protein C7959_13024 [Orenia marismortui]